MPYAGLTRAHSGINGDPIVNHKLSYPKMPRRTKIQRTVYLFR